MSKNISTTSTQRQEGQRRFRLFIWEWSSRAGQYVLMSILLIIFLVPIFWMVTSSIRPLEDIFRYIYPLSWKTFIPTEFTSDGYFKILFSENTYWPKYIFNSVFVAFTTVIVGTFINALAAWGFARSRFPGRDLLFMIILATIIIPFQVIVLPLFLVIKTLDWTNTYQALIVPVLANAFNIFLLRQFFIGIPIELEEAAIIDGASPLKIFFTIAIPLSWPALITTGLITFQASWDSFLWPLIATTSPDVRVIQLGLSILASDDASYWDEIFAAVAVAASVPIIMYLFLRRFYRQGISTTGITG